MRHKRSATLVLAAALLGSPVAMAQSPADPPATLQAMPSTMLYRVDEGLFDLNIGESMDLTDERILLTFSNGSSEKEIERNARIQLRLSGSNDFWVNRGARIDLTRELDMQNRDECFIDVIDFAVPKGAPMVATFRFHCP